MKKKSKIPEWTGFISFPLYFVIIVGLDLVFRYIYSFILGDDHLGIGSIPTVFTICWALIFTGIAVILPRVLSRIFMIASVAVTGIFALTHAVMYNLFGNFLSLSDMLYAGEGAEFFSITYVQFRKLLLACVILAVIGSVVAAVLTPRLEYRNWRVAVTALMLACGVGTAMFYNSALTVVSNNDGNQVMTWDVALNNTDASQNVTKEMIYTEFNNPNTCLCMTGLYQYTFKSVSTVLSISNAIGNSKNSIAAIDSFADEREPAGENKMTGALSGKNVIMIMAESLDSWMITEDFTPNIWALQQNSVNFVNNYTPLYLTAGTFGTEFISMTGIIPPLTGVSTNVYTDNAFPYSLPNLFENAGYTSNSFHSQSGQIYNRSETHQNLGFESYHNYADMGMDDSTLDSQLINGFDEMTEKSPFFSFIITYSGHGPYDSSMAGIAEAHMDDARNAVEKSGITGSEANLAEYTQAVAQIMQTDDFIGELTERLESAGLLDDTVIILYGDHFCKYMTDIDFVMQLKGVGNRNLLCNTPLMIYNTGLEPQTVEKYMSSVDIYPTVCNLFDLDVDTSAFVGDDAFGNGGGYVYWRDYSWYDGTTYYEDGKNASLTDEQLQRCNEVRRKLNISWNTLIFDYFAK